MLISEAYTNTHNHTKHVKTYKHTQTHMHNEYNYVVNLIVTTHQGYTYIVYNTCKQHTYFTNRQWYQLHVYIAMLHSRKREASDVERTRLVACADIIIPVIIIFILSPSCNVVVQYYNMQYYLISLMQCSSTVL